MKLKIGDIFTIPIGGEKIGFGQVVQSPINNGNFIMAIFEKIYPEKDLPGLKEIINDEILFLGYTMDALLHRKFWRIIGNESSNLDKIKLPYYKLGTPPDMKIVNFKGDKVRKASKDEFDKLEYETDVAPVRYENALKAYYKLGDWKEDYNKLLYKKTLESIKVVERK